MKAKIRRPYAILGERAAVKYARAKWGPRAHVEDWSHVPGAVERGERCRVGVIELGLFFAILGTGDTFDDAFDAAEDLTTTKPQEGTR